VGRREDRKRKRRGDEVLRRNGNGKERGRRGRKEEEEHGRRTIRHQGSDIPCEISAAVHLAILPRSKEKKTESNKEKEISDIRSQPMPMVWTREKEARQIRPRNEINSSIVRLYNGSERREKRREKREKSQNESGENRKRRERILGRTRKGRKEEEDDHVVRR